MTEDERALREAIVTQCRWMNARGLNQGTSGNISARHEDAMLITPSAVPYEDLDPGMIVRMPLSAEDGRFEGSLRPSTEWRFHRDILRARPEFGVRGGGCGRQRATRRGSLLGRANRLARRGHAP